MSRTAAPGMNSGSVEVPLFAFADIRSAAATCPLSTQVDNCFAKDPEFIPRALLCYIRGLFLAP